jgi:signal transduction histidine kinase
LILLAIEDVTARTEALTALRQTRNLLNLATDASHLGWGTWDWETGEMVWDERGKQVLGFVNSDRANRIEDWLARVHPDDRQLLEDAIGQSLTTNQSFRVEYRVLNPDGALRTILGTGIFLPPDDNHHQRGTGLVQDVTEQYLAEEQLRQLNETLEERVAQRTEQVRALASTLTMAEHEERQRISHVLHDDLQQLLYGIQMRMMMCIESINNNDTQKLPTIAKEVYDWLGEAIQTTRHLTVDLSPPVLEGEGLIEAIGWLITQMAEVYRLKVDLRATVDVPVPDKEMRLLLFQIVRELLFNVFKHAGTDRAVVEIEQESANTLVIRVIDEGIGFDVAAAEARYDGGFGLFSVRERLSLFGGHMSIDSAPDAGTQITIYTPSAYIL